MYMYVYIYIYIYKYKYINIYQNKFLLKLLDSKTTNIVKDLFIIPKEDIHK